MKTLEFNKYQGLGNDFVLIPAPALPQWLPHISQVCDRHRGIGADGVIGFDFDPRTSRATMVIYNADGTRPQMCGNGVRCVVAAIAEAGVVRPGDALVVDSDAGPRPCVVGARDARGSWHVEVEMGIPEIGARATGVFLNQALSWLPVDMGNPHAVTWFSPESMEQADALGQAANADKSAFPDGVNLEFVSATLAPRVVDVVVYERGVGRTQACGTGACAVAVALWEEGRVDRKERVSVRLPGGALELRQEAGRVWMSGPATQVFAGRWSR